MKRLAATVTGLWPTLLFAGESRPDTVLVDVWLGYARSNAIRPASDDGLVGLGMTLLVRGGRLEGGIGLDLLDDFTFVGGGDSHAFLGAEGGAAFDLTPWLRADLLGEIGLHGMKRTYGCLWCDYPPPDPISAWVPCVGARAGIHLRGGPFLLGAWLIFRQDVAFSRGSFVENGGRTGSGYRLGGWTIIGAASAGLAF